MMSHGIHGMHGKGLALVVLGMMIGGVVNAATVTATTDAFRLSIKHDGVRESAGDETLTYSSRWDGGDGATVTIAQDGTALVQNLSGEGERAWNVRKTGTYTLSHTTYTNGVAGKVETATFVVPGPELTFEYDGGQFVGGTLTINGGIDGWTIYYTLDGSTPTTESTKYTGPFTLSSDATVRAFAVSGNGFTTDVIGKEYAVIEHARIENVRARQRWPWNGKVDIDCKVYGIYEAIYRVKFAVFAVDLDSGNTNKVSHFWVVRDGVNSNDRVVHTNGEYRLVWDARADLGEAIYSNMVVSVSLAEDVHNGIQLWEGGPYWAETNIGADAPWEYGYYFWWGDIIGYSLEGDYWEASDGSPNLLYDGGHFKEEDVPTYGKNISTLQSEGWITPDNALVLEHDAARVHWGDGWRMPTDRELSDLDTKCDRTWTFANGVRGCVISGRGDYASASIFLPAKTGFSSGFYWSSVPHLNSAGMEAWDLRVHPGPTYPEQPDFRFHSRTRGQAIRPVRAHVEAMVAAVVIAGDSAPFLLDTHAGVRESAGDETLTYSSLWDGGNGATVTISQDGSALVEGLTGEGERAWSVTRNGTYVLTHTTYTNGVAGQVETATFVVTGKDVPFSTADVTVSSYSNKYDGTAHGIGVTVASGIENVALKYAVGDGTPTLPWGTEPPTLTDAGSMTVWCEIAAPGYITQTNSATVTISKRAVTLTSGDASKVYDGTALVKHEVAVGGDGFVAGEGASYNFTGSQIGAGSSANSFTYALGANTKAGNYAIETVNGSLTVAKATYDMSGAKWDYAGEFKYDGGQKTVLVTGLPAGVTVSAYSGNTGSAPGTYTAHVEFLYDTTNYDKPEVADLVWVIRSAEETKLKEIFEDLPAAIEPDGAGGWTVKVTNDIDSADLPIEIPDNLGQVTIDLGGHDLIGGNGDDGDGTTPGGDGKPAIVIVPGGGGDPTRLTIITTGDDSLVKGGDGGAGNPGGKGAPAIKVEGGTNGGVKIDVGEGVTVRGGDGGASETGRGGDGGAGIDGDVGTNDGTIEGGAGGDSVDGDGGDGGHGVDGDVDVNNGTISGGNGGHSDHGLGGDGGRGVTGDVGTNNGTIAGGKGGGTNDGTPGEDGIPVGGTIGGGSGTVVKVNVAVPEVPSAEYTGEAIAPLVPTSALYAVSASGGTRPGSYPVMLTLLDMANYEWIPRDGATVNGALAVVNFVIIDPPPHIETEGDGKSGRENAASVVATYDGAGHGISVTVTYPPTGVRIRYARSEKGPFTDEKPLFTNAVDAAETWYELSADGFEPVTNMATVTIAPRSLAMAVLGSLRFVDRGGVRTPVPTLVDDLGHEVPPSDYVFTWEEEASGAMTLSFEGRGNYLGLFGTKLAQTRFHVVFDANGGEVDSEGADYDIGTYYGVLPIPSKAGYLFDGWYEKADFAGEPVTRNTQVIAQDLTLHAKWLRRALWYTDATFHLEGAATYDGYVVDPAAGDRVAGTIQVKAGKPNKKTGLSKLTVTVQLAGGKKTKFKGSTFDGALTGNVGGLALDLRLGYSSLTGTLGGYALDGARNVFTAKDADSKVVAAQALKQWQGTYVAAWEGASGWNGLSLDVKSKGKVKVSGTLADGAKVSAKSQLLVGERECALAVSWTKKGASVACLVWFCEDGTVECMNADGAATLIANARDGATLPSGAAFRIDAATMSAVVPGLQAELLPDGVEVRMKGAKFDIDKAGKVSAKGGAVDLSKAGTNPAGLKLSYKMKNCTFKGSFSAYALSGGKLKKVKVTVSGVVLGRKGYGTASIKKVGSVPISIE